LSQKDMMLLTLNAFEASWLSREEKDSHISDVKNYFQGLERSN